MNIWWKYDILHLHSNSHCQSTNLLVITQEHAQSAAFSNNGEIVIIGTTSGRWFVMDSETREMYSQHQDGNEPIQVNYTCMFLYLFDI